MERKPLIAGYDPGTTAGLALLSVDGKLLDIMSGKNISQKELLLRAISKGKVILVGTDKAKIPSSVDSFAKKLGARVTAPKEDLKTEEKQKLIGGIKTRNDHQLDALAAAFFCFNENKKLLNKIDVYAKNRGMEDIKDKIKEIVLTRRISINEAVKSFEQPKKIIRKVITIEQKQDSSRLREQIRKYKRDIELLRGYIDRLSEEESNKKIEVTIRRRKDFRDKVIVFLNKEIKERKKEICKLKEEKRMAEEFIAESNGCYITKKLRNLGYDEYESKRKILKIKKGDFLFVDNPKIANEKTLRELEGKNNIIFSPRKAKLRDPFIVVNVDKPDKEYGNYALISIKKAKEKMQDRERINEIIKDYQKNRPRAG